MKKFAAFLSVAMTACLLAAPGAAVDVEISAAYGTPVVDGEMDALYEASEAYGIKYGNQDDFSTADVYYLWDESALYIYADVTDDTPSTSADTSNIGDIWKTDCIEFGLNMIRNEVGDPHSTSRGGVWLAAPQYGDQMDIYSPLHDIPAVAADTECVTTTTDKGWAVELKLPIFNDDTDLVPGEGEEYGIYALMHNDTNDDNARDSETFPNKELVYASRDTSQMDYIVLLAKPEVVETEIVDTPVEESAAPATADMGYAAAAVMVAAAAAFVLTKKH